MVKVTDPKRLTNLSKVFELCDIPSLLGKHEVDGQTIYIDYYSYYDGFCIYAVAYGAYNKGAILSVGGEWFYMPVGDDTTVYHKTLESLRSVLKNLNGDDW